MERRRSGAGAIREALLVEAALLGHCRQPGITELVEVTDDGLEATVVTSMPAGLPLEEATLDLEEVAGVGAVLATTVADLHDIGVAHGSVGPGFVVLASDGRPVLDGFSSARRLAGHPSRWARHGLARADDVQLGHLLAGLVVSTGPEGRAAVNAHVARRRFSRRPRWGTAGVIADWATATSRGAITSRRLAEGLAVDVPGARLPSTPVEWQGTPTEVEPRPASHDPSTIDHPSPPPVMGVGAAVLVALLAAGTVRLLSPGHGPAGGHRTLPPTAPVAACAPPPANPPACGLPRYADGVLTVASQRYAVGEAGDVVALGRWTCGAPTLALFRPATGRAWRFT